MSGDGNFAAKVDRVDRERRTTAKLTGRSFSEVVPAAGIILPAILAFAVLR